MKKWECRGMFLVSVGVVACSDPGNLLGNAGQAPRHQLDDANGQPRVVAQIAQAERLGKHHGESRRVNVISQCRKNPQPLPQATGCYVDVTTDPITIPARDGMPPTEVSILKDIDFDALGINEVTAIEQLYPVQCGGACADIENHPRPWECTGGVTDVVLLGYESKANFNPDTRLFPVIFGDAAEPLFLSTVLHPGDRALGFRGQRGRAKRASLKLGAGGGSRITVGSLGARMVRQAQDYDAEPITLRFHTPCHASPRKAPSSAFLLSVNFAGPEPDFLQFSDEPQSRTVRISAANLEHFITEVNEQKALQFLQLGVVGHHWLTSTKLEVLRANGHTELVVDEDHFNFFGTKLPDSNLVLRPGDEIRFTCEYANTLDPPIEFFPEDFPDYPNGVIPISPATAHAPCTLQGVYTDADCDGQLIATFADGGELLGFDCRP